MSKYKGLFTFDVENHRYLPVEQADGLIAEMDYHPEPEPKEPLIKDEKIRKAVRAWAEINSIEKARVNVSSNGARGIEPSWFSIIGLDENGCSWAIEIHADYFETVSKCYKGDMVGIAELCGEEEE